MIAARSFCPYSIARRLASSRPLDRFILVPGAHVGRRQRKQVAGRLGVARLRQLRQLGDGLVVLSESQQHSSEIEPREPESRLRVERLPVLVACRAELLAALENLSEVVVGLRVRGIEREGLPVGVRGEIPFLLQAEQDAVVVVRFAEIAAKRDRGPVVLLGFCPVRR